MAPSLRFLSGFNGYVPRATGVVVAFIKDPDKFPINRYIQYIPTPQDIFLWTQLGRDAPNRIVTDAEFAFEDGNERPTGIYNQMPYVLQEGRCFRRSYGWVLGHKAIQQTSSAGTWEPEPVHMKMALSQCMVNRTNKLYTLVSNPNNWGGNTATADTLNGGAGSWVDASSDDTSPNYLAIFKTLQAVYRNIDLATNAVVTADMLNVVIGPDLAIIVSETSELNNYVRETSAGNMNAVRIQLEGWDSPQMAMYGIPKSYRGYQLVVDNTPIVNQRPNTTNQTVTTGTNDQAPESAEVTPPTVGRQFIYQPNLAVVMSREGALDGSYGTVAYSTIQLYHYEGLAQVEAFNDQKNRRLEGFVTEDYGIVMASNVSGYLIQGCNT
jgi:hypothetical protein